MLKQFQKTLLVVSIFLVAFTLMVSNSAFATEKLSGPAKDFTLKSRSGKNIRLAEQKGNVVLINFWASWCAPCRQEMPKLEELHNKYKDLGFVLLGINLDATPDLSKKLLKDIKVTFPVLFDPENEVSEAYNVESMPTTVIVDKNGNWRFLHKGYQPGYENDYADQVKQLLRE
ncbi:MAG TPA: TlpA family protein disulfide reductase [Aeromonadales bacterium]|nr:TlpA family protein disulfide reductase [Aeromonadales bacterium]